MVLNIEERLKQAEKLKAIDDKVLWAEPKLDPNCKHERVFPSGNSYFSGGYIVTDWYSFICMNCGIQSKSPIGHYKESKTKMLDAFIIHQYLTNIQD